MCADGCTGVVVDVGFGVDTESFVDGDFAGAGAGEVGDAGAGGASPSSSRNIANGSASVAAFCGQQPQRARWQAASGGGATSTTVQSASVRQNGRYRVMQRPARHWATNIAVGGGAAHRTVSQRSAAQLARAQGARSSVPRRTACGASRQHPGQHENVLSTQSPSTRQSAVHGDRVVVVDDDDGDDDDDEAGGDGGVASKDQAARLQARSMERVSRRRGDSCTGCARRVRRPLLSSPAQFAGTATPVDNRRP
jgi:hypothetical protein